MLPALEAPIVGKDLVSKRFKRIISNVKKMGAGMQSMGSSMTMGVTVPVLGAGAAALKVGADFDYAMRKVQAKVTITTKSMKELREQAKFLGRTTQFTAREAAGAQEKLAMAGWESHEVFAALPAVLDLTAASGEELITTADIMSNIMSGFQVDTKEASHVADVFATVVSSSNVDMISMADTMKYAQTIAKTFGVSLEQTAAATGFLGNMGIKGTMAGTALTTMMTRLAAPTDSVKTMFKETFGVDIVNKTTGKIRDFTTIIKDLSGAMATMGQAERIGAAKEIFDQRALKVALPLLEDSTKVTSGFVKLQQSLANMKPGKAKGMRDIMEGGATGAMNKFKSALEGVAIAFAESGLLDKLTKIATIAAKWLGKVEQLSPQMKGWIVKIGLVAAAIGPLLTVAGSLVSVIGSIASGIGAAGGISAVLAALTGPVGLAVAGFALLVAATIYLWDEIQPIRTAFAEELPKAFGLTTSDAGNATSMFKNMGDTLKSVTKIFAPLIAVFIRINLRVNPMIVAFKVFIFLLKPLIWLAKQLFRMISYLAREIAEYLTPKLAVAGEWFGNLTTRVLNFLGPVGDAIRYVGTLTDKLDTWTASLGEEKKLKLGAEMAGGVGAMGPAMFLPADVRAQLETKQKSEVIVKFADMPKGTEVKTDGNVKVQDLNRGSVMQTIESMAGVE
jgi:TP901 family phage tail tape measure protein